MDTVTSSREVPACTRWVVPTGAPRGRGRLRAGGRVLEAAVVDAVVAAHQGHVEVTSQPGRTVFTITLPLPAPAPDPPA